MIRFYATLSAAALLAACSPEAGAPQDAPPPEAPAVTDSGSDADAWPPIGGDTIPAIRGADIGWRVSVLADDRFEGRAPASEGGMAASQWIADEMARIGLEPAGENGTYFQAVPLVESTLDLDTAHFDISVNGEPMGLVTGADAVYWTKRPSGSETVTDSELVFVGYGVVAPEYGWNDYAGLDVEGRTVVMLVNDPGFVTEDPDLFNGRAMTYYGRWTYKYEEAMRQGATGAIIIHQTAPASYGWNVVSSSWSGTQFDLIRADAANRAAVEGWVTEDVARRMFEAAALDFDALAAAAHERGFTPVEMTGLTLDATLNTEISRLESRNVAGVLRGSARPDEYVLYTAHWDHLGERLNFAQDDNIYNGAVDNATGTAAILEIAEAFAGAETPPERSVLFLSVTAEESGLLGSAFYAQSPLVPLADTVAGLNIDGMLPTGPSHDVVVVGYGASELEDILTEEAAGQNRVIVPDPNPEAGYFYRSDHIELAKVGVPMLYADGGEDLIEGGTAEGRRLSEEYRINNYHQPSDEYSNDWNLDGLEQDTQLFFQVGARVANSDAWPNWYEGNEFRALRNAMMEN